MLAWVGKSQILYSRGHIAYRARSGTPRGADGAPGTRRTLVPDLLRPIVGRTQPNVINGLSRICP